MEGPGLNLLKARTGDRGRAKLPESAPQLAGGPGRERHGEDAVRADHAGSDRIADPVRDRPRLAGARAG